MVSGQLARYSGGGYVANISRDSLTEARKTLENIKQSKWLDRYTRCIFLEFNLINPGPGLILNVIVAFELDGTSGMFPVHSISAAHFYFNSRKENWLSVCEGLTVICVIFYTFVEMSVVTEQGIINYFRKFWNWLEIAVLLISYMVGVLYLLQLIAFYNVLNIFKVYGHARFIDFQTVLYNNFLYNFCLGILGSLAIFKMLKVITFNPFLITYTKTLETISSEFAAYSFIAIIFLLSFSMSGMIIFGHEIYGYMSFDRALFNLLFFILKKTDYENLVATNRVLGPLFFLIVMTITQYLIVNFFIAVLREGLEMAKHVSFQIENAAIQYIARVMLQSLGIYPEDIKK
ncbi:hypothetical protein Btru_005677 [Bulinus truncatus]|nr:hypothetical protein Btru_005677 [Bulinus truncatus]